MAYFRIFSHALSDVEVLRVYFGEDSDGDGIGDHWERRILASSTTDNVNRLSHVGGSSDFDQDGISDAAEYHFGTDPLGPTANGLIKSTRLSEDQNNIEIRIDARTSRNYVLRASETLEVSDEWLSIQESGFITSDGEYVFTIPIGVFHDRFFRIEANVE